jgi:hypothetical protein
MALATRPELYCFAPRAHNWAAHLSAFSFWLMLASPLVALVGFRYDARHVFSGITLGLFLPLLIIVALAYGCN